MAVLTAAAVTSFSSSVILPGRCPIAEAIFHFVGFFIVNLKKEGTNMKNTKRIVLSALLLSLGLVFPFLTGQIPEIGNMLLPMHIPVLICGFACGWPYGLLVGFITPLLRSFLFGMPPLPYAIAMAFELATYGAMTGLFYKKLENFKIRIYISLLAAMVAGRLVWAVASFIIYTIQQSAFTWQIFINGALLTAIPGIILQIVLIPILVLALEKSGVMKIDD